MLKSVFMTLVTVISIYSFMCVIRIVLSWIPNAEYSTLGSFFSRICDPYLNWFKKFPFTQIGFIDFSPIIALGVLSVGLNVFTVLATTGKISFGIVLASILKVLWSYFSFLLNIFIIIFAIRLIVSYFVGFKYSPFLTMIDRFLNPAIYYFTKFFYKNRHMDYKTSLILTTVVLLAIRIGLGLLIKGINILLFALPF